MMNSIFVKKLKLYHKNDSYYFSNLDKLDAREWEVAMFDTYDEAANYISSNATEWKLSMFIVPNRHTYDAVGFHLHSVLSGTGHTLNANFTSLVCEYEVTE